MDNHDIVLLTGLILTSFVLALSKHNSVLISMYILLMFCIASYNIYCVSHGKCFSWSNILTIIYVILATILIISLKFNIKLN